MQAQLQLKHFEVQRQLPQVDLEPVQGLFVHAGHGLQQDSARVRHALGVHMNAEHDDAVDLFAAGEVRGDILADFATHQFDAAGVRFAVLEQSGHGQFANRADQSADIEFAVRGACGQFGVRVSHVTSGFAVLAALADDPAERPVALDAQRDAFLIAFGQDLRQQDRGG